MAGIQAWRFAGLGFIALYAYGVLPGLFAWPAGLGDMAIGVTAPLVIYALRRRPAFAVSSLFWVWNLFVAPERVVLCIVAMAANAILFIERLAARQRLPRERHGVGQARDEVGGVEVAEARRASEPPTPEEIRRSLEKHLSPAALYQVRWSTRDLKELDPSEGVESLWAAPSAAHQ